MWKYEELRLTYIVLYTGNKIQICKTIFHSKLILSELISNDGVQTTRNYRGLITEVIIIICTSYCRPINHRDTTIIVISRMHRINYGYGRIIIISFALVKCQLITSLWKLAKW